MKRNRFINPKNGAPMLRWSTVAYQNMKYFKHVRIINDLNLLRGRRIEDVVYVDEFSPIVFKVEGIKNPLYLAKNTRDWGFNVTTDAKNNYYLTFDAPSKKWAESLWKRLKEIGMITQEFEDDYKEALVVHDFEQYEQNIEYHSGKLREAQEALVKLKKEYTDENHS